MPASPRPQDSASRIYFALLELIGGLLKAYSASVPVLGLNVASTST